MPSSLHASLTTVIVPLCTVASFVLAYVYHSYMGDMPWLSVPYDGKTRGTIAQLLGVTALPTLLVFDEDQQLITANGRQEIIKDQKGENFPWYPKVGDCWLLLLLLLLLPSMFFCSLCFVVAVVVVAVAARDERWCFLFLRVLTEEGIVVAVGRGFRRF